MTTAAWIMIKKGLSFISNRQRRKEGTFCASELAGIEPTPPAPEEQGMPALPTRLREGMCLGSSAVELALPLNAAEHPKLSLASLAGDQVVHQYGIQLPSRPLLVTLGGYAQLLTKVFANPLSQF